MGNESQEQSEQPSEDRPEAGGEKLTDEQQAEAKRMVEGIRVRVAGGFAKFATALDGTKANARIAAHQAGLLGRQAAILDVRAALWSKLLQDVQGDPKDWPPEVGERFQELDKARPQDLVAKEAMELGKLQEQIQKPDGVPTTIEGLQELLQGRPKT